MNSILQGMLQISILDMSVKIIKTHWGRVTHVCVGNLAIIGSDNGLSPGRRQAIIWTDAGILLIGPLGTNFSEIWIGIHTFSLKKIHLKMSSAKWCLFCLGLNVLIQDYSGISQGAMTWLVNDGVSYWCAILIAHQIVMAKHGGSCVHFSGISTCGRTSRETVSHSQRQPLPTPHKIALPVYVTVTNKRLQPLTTTLYNSRVLYFSLLITKRRLI